MEVSQKNKMLGNSSTSSTMRSSNGSQGRRSTPSGGGGDVTTYTVRADGTSDPKLPKASKLGRSRILFVPPVASECVGLGGGAIPLTWNALRHVGSGAQKERLNRLRIAYISALVETVRRHCRPELGGCEINPVGTDYRRATSASDADLNFVFNTEASIPWTKTIEDLYGALRAFHGEHFPDTSMADLFDVNVYASNFVSPVQITCTGADDMTCLRSSCPQRSWACLRLAEVLHPRAADPQRSAFATWFVEAAGTDFADKVLAPALDKLAVLRASSSSRSSLTYATRVGRALSAARDARDDNSADSAADAAESFSESKLYERDTYRSVGAFLHVVGGYRCMHPSMYIDSALDNLGFLVDNLLEDKVLGCIEVSLEHRLLRVAKYLERTCDALILSLDAHAHSRSCAADVEQQQSDGRLSHAAGRIAEAVTHLSEVRDACKLLNEARKGANPTNIGEGLGALKTLIAPDSVWESSGGRSEEKSWLVAIGVTFLRSLPYGNLCKSDNEKTMRRQGEDTERRSQRMRRSL